MKRVRWLGDMNYKVLERRGRDKEKIFLIDIENRGRKSGM